MINKTIIFSFILLSVLLTIVSYNLDYPFFIVSYTSCMAAVLTVFLFINPKN